MGIIFGAIILSKENSRNSRTKHIDISYHLARNYIQNGTITLSYIGTEFMPAEMLTKPVGSVKIYSDRKRVRLNCLKEIEEVSEALGKDIIDSEGEY